MSRGPRLPGAFILLLGVGLIGGCAHALGRAEARPADPEQGVSADLPCDSIPTPVRALDAGPPPAAPARTHPRLQLTLGAWVWGMSGRLGRSGDPVDVESTWRDTLEALDALEFALNSRLRIEWGRWSASLELDGAEVADTVRFDRLGAAIDARASLWILQGQAGYRVAGRRLGCGTCAPVGCLEVYGGARAYWTGVEARSAGALAPLSGRESSDRWVEPLLGLRGDVRWPSGWWLRGEADVGGLDGDRSRHALGAVGYRFSERVSVGAGWKVLDVDHRADGHVFDVRLEGPFLALTVTL